MHKNCITVPDAAARARQTPLVDIFSTADDIFSTADDTKK